MSGIEFDNDAPIGSFEIKTAAKQNQNEYPSHTGDGSCDHCGKIPSIVMNTSLCDECADGVKRAEEAEKLLQRAERVCQGQLLVDIKNFLKKA